MLHSFLTDLFLSAFAQDTAIAPLLSRDGALSLSFEGGLFGPGACTVSVPAGMESAVAACLQALETHARVPLFVGVAAMGQPTGLSRVDARLRLGPARLAPGQVHMPFFLELGA